MFYLKRIIALTIALTIALPSGTAFAENGNREILISALKKLHGVSGFDYRETTYLRRGKDQQYEIKLRVVDDAYRAKEKTAPFAGPQPDIEVVIDGVLLKLPSYMPNIVGDSVALNPTLSNGKSHVYDFDIVLRDKKKYSKYFSGQLYLDSETRSISSVETFVIKKFRFNLVNSTSKFDSVTQFIDFDAETTLPIKFENVTEGRRFFSRFFVEFKQEREGYTRINEKTNLLK